MADSIGAWSLSLTANASGLVKGLEDSAKKTADFTKQVTSMTKTMASGMNSALLGIARIDLGQQTSEIGKLASAAMGVASGFALGGVAGGVVAVASLVGALISFSSASMDAIATQAKLGKAVGVSAQEIAGLQVIANRAGVAPETVSHSLSMWALQVGHLNSELHAGHAGPISLALDRMGISAREFARQSLPEQLAAIAEGSQRIGNMTERNAAVFAVLGRHARDLAPLLRQPAEELRDMAGVAASVGYNISQADATAIAGTVKRLKEGSATIGAMFNAIGQEAAVMFAPVADFVGETLRMIVTEAMPVVKILGSLLFIPALLILGPGITAIVSVVRLGMPILSAFSKVVTAVYTAFRDNFAKIEPVVTQIWESISSTFGGANPIEMLGRAISSTIPAIVWGIDQLGNTLAGVVNVAAASVQRIASIVDAVKPLLGGDEGGFRASFARGVGTGLGRVLGGAGSDQGNFAYKPQMNAVEMSRGFSAMAEEIERGNRQLGMTREQIEINKAWEDRLTLSQIANLQRVQEARTRFESQVAVDRAATNLFVQAENQGLTEQEVLLRNAQRLGVPQFEIDRLRFAVQLTEQMQEQNRLRQRGEQLRESLRTPGEQFQQRILEAQQRADNGGGLGLFQRETASAFEELMRATNRDPGAAQAVLAGTVEQQRAIAQAQRDERRNNVDPIERVRQVLEQQRQLQLAQRDYLAEFTRLARDGFIGQLGN